MKKLRIHLFSEYFYPTEESTGFILTQIARRLITDNEVIVHTVKNKKNCGNINEFCNVYRYLVPNLNEDKILSRLIKQMIIFFRFKISALRRLRKNDIVIVVTNPPFLIVLFAFLKLFISFKYVVLVHDVFPENAVSIGLLKKNGLAFFIISYVFNLSLKRSDFLVTCGRDMELLIKRKTRNKVHIVTIPHWGELAILEPQVKADNTIILDNNLLHKTIFLFAGNIGRLQGISILLEAAKLLSERKDIHFIFAGGGAKENLILNYIEQGYKNVSKLPPFHRDEQIVILNACDVGIVSLDLDTYGVGVPSKTYNLMAAGKPILGILEEDTEIGLLISEERIGWLVKPENVRLIVEKILAISGKPLEIKEFGIRSRIVCESKYSFENYIFKLNKVLQDL